MAYKFKKYRTLKNQQTVSQIELPTVAYLILTCFGENRLLEISGQLNNRNETACVCADFWNLLSSSVT
jgi:hypothetical protein